MYQNNYTGTSKYNRDLPFILLHTPLVEQKHSNANDSICVGRYEHSDNEIAVEMLKSVTEIIRAIEYDDVVYIEKALKSLREETDRFESVFRSNLKGRMYDR